MNRVPRAEPLEIIGKLPSLFGSERAEDVPQDLIGAKIIRFGMVGSGKYANRCNLAIEYLPRSHRTPRSVILAFGDAGMWITGEVEQHP